MRIERQKISPTELLLFFPAPLPITGTFYHSKNAPSNLGLLENISAAGQACNILLSRDFIYIKSASENTLEDLEALALAELDDFASSAKGPLTAPETDIPEKIKIILKTIIAPFLQKDGGNVEFISYEKDTVKVRFLGRCNGCPYANRTLKEQVEKKLIRCLPQIKEVILA